MAGQDFITRNLKLFVGVGLGIAGALSGVIIWKLFLKNAYVTGFVIDKSSRAPIEGALLTLHGGEGIYLSSLSKPDGTYEISGDILVSYNAQGYAYYYYYDITAEADGYQSQLESNLTFHPAGNQVNFELEAI